jgi:phosphatidylethanolamine-binding protein (PEBP) family uncharacterized protein
VTKPAAILPLLAALFFALLIRPVDAQDPAKSEFAVDFTWAGTASCFDPKSPLFTLSQVPAGTESLRFTMVDLDAPSYPHGGGTVVYHGERAIPRGAFAYHGPCPPSGRHRYQWTIEARDGAGGVLAQARVTKIFPP